MKFFEMLLNLRLRNSFVISLVGHIALLGVFGFSFGYKFPKTGLNEISFLGSILHNDFINTKRFISSCVSNANTGFFIKRGEISQLGKASTLIGAIGNSYYLKPRMPAEFTPDKAVFNDISVARITVAERKKPVITFYPLLPTHFPLYFKDRQTAHIELEFSIISQENKEAIMVKRKISSGNLEADLLSMRYISRYLFMQRTSFAPNNWQTVEIDLSEKKK